MLVFIPASHENKWYVNCLFPFLPLAQWTQWRTVMIHRLFSQNVYWLKTDRSLNVISKSAQYFFASWCAKFCVQTSGLTEGLKLTLFGCRLRPNSLKIPILLFFDFLIFISIYSCAVVKSQRAGKWFLLNQEEMRPFSRQLHAALYNFTVTSSSHV